MMPAVSPHQYQPNKEARHETSHTIVAAHIGRNCRYRRTELECIYFAYIVVTWLFEQFILSSFIYNFLKCYFSISVFLYITSNDNQQEE